MVQITAAAISSGDSGDFTIDQYGEMVDVNAWARDGNDLEKI